MYRVSYCPCENTTPDEYDAIRHLPTEELHLEDVMTACQTYHCEADLYDETGFHKGWVCTDGIACLTSLPTALPAYSAYGTLAQPERSGVASA